MEKLAKNYSLGCELQPPIFDKIDEFKKNNILDHIQITIPNTIKFQTAHSFSEKIKTIAHSNLLNTLGENNWEELDPVSRQLKKLCPNHLVEHFTCFRSSNGLKSGVSLPENYKFIKNLVVSNILKWQDITNIPIALENVPIAENFIEYFDFLLEIKNLTGCLIACDLPHFLLSGISCHISENEMQAYAKNLNPIQIHLGGLSIKEDLILDNHKIFSPWIRSQSSLLFPNTHFITLEQNHKTSSDYIENVLNLIIQDKFYPIPNEILNLKGISSESLNNELANETAVNNKLPTFSRMLSNDETNHTKNLIWNPFLIYNKYIPFIYPLDSIKNKINEIDAPTSLEPIVNFAHWSMSYLSWWHPILPNIFEIIYEDNGKTKFQKTIGEIKDYDWKNDLCFEIEFQSTEYTINLKTPNLSRFENNITKKEQLWELNNLNQLF